MKKSDNTEVLMPLMGEGITEATLVKWLKAVGDSVRKDEPLLEVSTDKVDTEIPSPGSGQLLQIFAKDGDLVPINQVIAMIGVAAGDTSAPAKADVPAAAGAATPAGGSSTTPAAGRGTGSSAATADLTQAASFGFSRQASGAVEGLNTRASGLRSSPLVRKMARALQIDLAHVAGSGMHGRITKRDIEAHQSAALAAAPAARAAPAAAFAAPAPLATRRDGDREFLDGVPVRREKMSRMRSLIAEHMVRSVRTSPHVTTIFEIDLHRVVAAREKAKAAFAAREGFNLTYTPFFVHAAVQAIKAFPVVNVSLDGDDILWKDQINMGVAVAIESGLIVPVVRNAGELNLLGIARRIHDLAQRARTKKLTPEDVQGGTFSVTNPGMFGSLVSSPIINQPQVAILSIGAIIKRPVVIDDLIGIRPLVQIGLTFDHRVVDGEGGARFLAFLKETLENFRTTEF